ncbi:MAG: phosphoribosylaminoimidazolesuccinocarboxamide synthase [Candidatus Coatesbacteria bacterium]|nr:MAG: phosphoribosylaminoimidazolesuccinocarboxamide synthase [Candidatus Coatesbacteria bacterium]
MPNGDVTKGELLYEGKAKKIYVTSDPALLWAEFKDDATAFDGDKKGTIVNKGVYNVALSEAMFKLLDEKGVPTHYVDTLSDRELLVRRLDIHPVEIVVRNVSAGSVCKRYGIDKGITFDEPIIEYFLKNDELHDPMLNRQHVTVLGYAPADALEVMEKYALAVNEILSEYMLARGVRLVDFKLEFGSADGKVYLGDEITPDTCRLWDAETGEVFDKDRFRHDMGEVEDHYAAVVKLLTEG